MKRLITYIRQFFGTIEQVLKWHLVYQHAAYLSQDVECLPVELAVMFFNGYQTVCYNRNIDLYYHNVLGLIARKTYRPAKQNVIRRIKQVLLIKNLVVELGLLSNDKEGVYDVDSILFGKVKKAFVIDVERMSHAICHSYCKDVQTTQIGTNHSCLQLIK